MRILLASLALLVSTSVAPAQELPEDLKRVPGNAVGFVHIRVADLWKAPTFQMYRDLLPKAGADAVKMLERINPPLATIDRVTLVLFLAPNGDRPKIAFIVHTSVPFDRNALTANLAKINNDQNQFVTPNRELIEILSEKSILVGEGEVAALMAQGGPPPETFRRSLLRAATGKRAIVAAANMTLLPADAIGGLPPFVQPFARANTVVASLDLGKEMAVELELGFADGDHASEAEKAFAGLRLMGKGFLQQAKGEMQKKLAASERSVPIYEVEKVGEIVGPVLALAAIARGEELLAEIPVTRDNNRVAVTLRVPEEMKVYAASTPILIGLLLPAVQKVRESSSTLRDANNLKQLALAMHAYHDTYKKFPAPAICDKAGKPLLSWRVAILPFIEENELYEQFKLDEPWDSDHNKKLIARMPPTFRLMSAQPEGSTDTHFRVFVGPNGAPSALFRNPMTGTSIRAITDGTTRTIMIAAADDAVPWTKPDELKYDPQQPLPKLKLLRRGYLVGLCDGSVWRVPETVTERQLRAAITRDGGEADRLPEVD